MPTLIVHDIELLPSTTPEAYERFVTERDYAECPHFASLLAFSVVRVGDGGRHYREFITVTDQGEFAEEMETDRFRRLAQDFDGLARVTGESVHPLVGRGHVAVPAGVAG